MPYGGPDLYELISNPEEYIQNYPLYNYYKGFVVDVKDPEYRGRVRVRVEDVWKSTPKESGDQMQPVPTNALPWADLLIHGQNKRSGFFTVPPIGTAVIVVFEKGDVSFPFVLGGWYGREEIPLAAMGGNEGKTDTAGDLKGQDTGVSTAGGGTISEPDNPYAAEYPNNQVFRTPAGHLVEFDDTSGAERINIAHTSGTWVEFHPDGSLVFGVQGKRYTVVVGDDGEHVQGNQDVVVDGDSTHKTSNLDEEVNGDYTQDVLGKSTVEVQARSTHTAASVLIESNSTLDLKASGLLKLGPGLAPGNIVTTVTHPVDYITGIPIQGVPTVQAG